MNTQRRLSSKSSRIVRKPATGKNGLRRFSLPEMLEARMMLSVSPITVTNNADSGNGSLRAAITAVNNDLMDPNAVDVITFKLDAPYTPAISLLSPLPEITHSVVIDGLDLTSNSKVQIDGSVPSNTLSDDVNGFTIDATYVTVRNFAVGGFSGAGFFLNPGSLNTGGADSVQNNYVGLLSDGVTPNPNGLGISVASGNNMVTGNVIAGNSHAGIDVTGNYNTLSGNRIGVDASGAAQGNGLGVEIFGNQTFDDTTGTTITVESSNNTVANNVISGNFGQGISLEWASSNHVTGNLIGTDANGNAGPLDDDSGLPVFGNTGIGVLLQNGAHDNTIGGSGSTDGNIIVGNQGEGVKFATGSGNTNTLQGNTVGLDITGAADGNFTGIVLESGAGTITGNVIAGNSGDGILLGSNHFTITGNWIGTDKSGTAQLGQSASGIYVTGSNNQIGGSGPGLGNVIAFNTSDGVFVFAGQNNAIQGNSIFSNATLGIALGNDQDADGNPDPLVNDTLPHDGPNKYQDYPVLTSVTGTPGNLTVTGSLPVDPSLPAGTVFWIDLYTNLANDPSGYGQGMTFIKTVMAVTNGTDTISLNINVSETVPSDQWVWSATATDSAHNTSEFSADVTAVISTATQAGSMTTVASSMNPTDFGKPLTFTATVTGVGGGTPSGTVTFMAGALNLGTFTLDSNGQASVSNVVLEPALLPIQITATYAGDTNFFGSNGSIAQVVNRASTTTTISTSAATVNAGTSVTFTATVTPAAGQYPTGTIVTGTVMFMDGSAQLGSATVDATGHAVFTTNSLAVGSHQIYAIYTSDVHFTSSESPVLNETVNAVGGTISGHTYFDVTGNGLSADDRTLNGITVKLFLDKNGNGTLDSGDGAAIKSIVSDNSGAYTFSNLAPGKYFVQETTPSGYVRTAPTNSTYYTDVMTSGLVIASNDFDNYQTGCCCNSLSNVKYVINGRNCYTDLRGHVHQGDTVQVEFTVLSGHADLLSLVSYTCPGSSFDANTASQQQVYQQASGTFGPGYHTMTVVVPKCYFQVDFVCGSVINQFGPAGSNIFYSAEDRLISADNGGTTPPPHH